MISNKRKLYIVAGPTAVGKSKYAIDLAKKIGGEIVSLDSIQVYKGLNIGSGKIADKEGVPHFMIDEIEPTDNINIKDFKDKACKYIEEIYNRNHIPILVGGTGFYINAILYDTDFIEEDEEKKNKIREELYEKDIDYLYEELKKVDPESAKIIHKNNVKRVIRALEYYKLNGTPISVSNAIEREKESPYDYTFYVLIKDKEKLNEDIDKRVDDMIKEGLLSEIKKLIVMGVKKTDQSMQGIGYKELYDYVKDDIDDKEKLNNLIDLIKVHTHQYAKRQITWFKNQENIEYVEK